MNWQEMTPRQRDALVAEKVMGLHVEHWTQKTAEGVDEDGDPTIYDLVTGYRVIHGIGTIPSHSPVPRYTHSMDAAWEVLAHLGIHFIVLERLFFRRSDTWGNDVWLWTCRLRYHDDTLFSSTAKQPAEAICHTVIKAVGVVVE